MAKKKAASKKAKKSVHVKAHSRKSPKKRKK